MSEYMPIDHAAAFILEEPASLDTATEETEEMQPSDVEAEYDNSMNDGELSTCNSFVSQLIFLHTICFLLMLYFRGTLTLAILYHTKATLS